MNYYTHKTNEGEKSHEKNASHATVHSIIFCFCHRPLSRQRKTPMESGVCMKSGILCFASIPFLLFILTKGEPAWCLLSFEINIFLAFIMASLGYLGEQLNKKEKRTLYALGIYYSLFTLIFLYHLTPTLLISYRKCRYITLSAAQIALSLLCNLWGLYRLKNKV